MDNMLKYRVNFDLDEGLKKAQADWKRVDQQLQAMVSNKGINMKVSIPNSKDMTELEQVAKRLQKLKLQPITPETRNAIRTLVAELKNMEKILLNIERINKGAKVYGSRSTDANREAIAQQKLNKAKTDAIRAEERLAQSKIKTEQAQLRLDMAQKKATATTNAQTSAYNRQGNALNSLKTSLRSYIGLFGAIRLGTKIREITGTFELQRVALGAIIRDTGKANQLFEQIKQVALESPFMVKDLVSYTKQLSAFRIETEILFDTTMRLADVSAGLGVDMRRLILAYGQVKAASVLRGQEVRQFTEAGIPLIQLLAEKFTELNGRLVSTSEVFELISNRAVPFEMIKEIFEDMTNAGGTFYNMQKIQSKTLAGSWANLQDAIDLAMNDIGQSQLGLMKTSINSVKAILENWVIVKNMLGTVGASYAVYKVVLLTTSIQQGIFSTSLITTTAAGKGLNAVIAKMIIGIRGIGAAIKANPLGFILGAITAVIGVILTWVSATRKAEKKQRELTDSIYKERLEVSSHIDALKEENITQGERLKIMNKISGYSQELADRIKKETEGIVDQTKKLKILMQIQDEYNKKKEAEVVLQRFSTSTGFDEVVEDFTDIEIKFQESKAKLIDKYTEFWNQWDIISDKGMKVGSNKKGDIIRFFSIEDKKEVNSIINSQKELYEKSIELNKWYRKEYDKANNPSPQSEFGYRMKILKEVFGGLGTREYQKSLKDYTDSQKELESVTEQMADKISTYYENMHGDLSKASIKTKNEISEVIMSLKNIPDETKKDLIIRVGVQVTEEDTKASLQNLDGLRKAVYDIFKEWEGESLGSKWKVAINPITILPEEGVNLTNFISDQKKAYKELVEGIENEERARENGRPTMKDDILQQNKYNKSLMETIAAKLGYTLIEKKQTDTRKAQNDTLKDEISLIKTAYKAYQELEKQIGSVSAKKTIKDLYGGQTKILSLVFSEKELREQLSKAQTKAKTKQEKFDIGVEISDSSFQELKDDLQSKIEEIKTLIDSEKEKINFYDTIFESTGREDVAKLLTENVFGGIGNIQDILKRQVRTAFIEPMKGTEEDLDKFSKAIEKALSGAEIDYLALQKLISQLPEDSRKTAEEIVNSGIEGNAKALKELIGSLKKHESFEDKKNKIRKDAEAYRNKLIENGIKDRDALIAQSEAKERKDLAALAVEELKASKEWVIAFDDLSKASDRSLSNLIVQIERLIEAQAGTLPPTEILALQKALNDLKKEQAKGNPFKSIVEGLKEYREAILNLKEARAEGNLSAEEETELMGKVAEGRAKLINGLNAISDVSSKMNTIINQTMELFGIAEDSEAGQTMKAFAESIGLVTSALGIMSTVLAVIEAELLPLLAVITVVSTLIALGSWLSNSDVRKANKEIEKQSKLLDDLEQKYKSLGKEVDKVFGKDFLKNVEERLNNIKAQIAVIKKQLEEERSKGKKADEDAIKGYVDALRSLNEEYWDLKDSIAERFLGSDLQSFSKDFASAMLDAYIEIGRADADTTEDIKKRWKSLMKSMIVESMIASVIQNRFAPLFEEINTMLSGGKLPTAEDINKWNQQGLSQIDLISSIFPQLLEGLDLQSLGEGMSGLSGLAKGIEGITEQQANVLSAAINTQNFYIIDIWTLLKKWDVQNNIGSNTISNLITIQNNYLQELPIIRDNTARTATACEKSATACREAVDTLKSVVYPINGKKAVNTTVS